MIAALLAVAGVLFAGGVVLILDGLRHSGRPSLQERLKPFQPPYVADEAQRWLSGQDMGGD